MFQLFGSSASSLQLWCNEASGACQLRRTLRHAKLYSVFLAKLVEGHADLSDPSILEEQVSICCVPARYREVLSSPVRASASQARPNPFQPSAYSFPYLYKDANALPKGSDPEAGLGNPLAPARPRAWQELQINFVFFDTQSKEYMQPEEEREAWLQTGKIPAQNVTGAQGDSNPCTEPGSQ